MKHLLNIILMIVLIVVVFSFLANYNYLKGYAFLFSGNYIKSHTYFSQLLKEEPKDIASCLLCGDSMARMGELERALDIFKYCNTFNIKVPFIELKIKPIEDILSRYNKIFLDFKLTLPTPYNEEFIYNENKRKLEEIKKFIKDYGKTNEAKLCGIIESFLLIYNGNLQEAEKSLLFNDNEPLKELKKYLLSFTYYKGNNKKKFINKTKEFIKKENDSILTPYFYLLLAEYNYREGSIEKAIINFLNAIGNKYYPSEIINLIVKRTLSFINEVKLDKFKYYNDLIKIIQTKKIPLTQNTIKLLLETKLLANISPNGLIKLANYLYDSKCCDLLEPIIKRGKNILEIKLIKAKCLYEKMNYNLSISELEGILKNKNGNKKIEDEAKLIFVRNLIKLKEYEKANQILNNHNFDESYICEVASLKIYLLSLMKIASHEFMEKLLEKYPKKACLQSLSIQLGNYYYSKHDFKTAEKWYEKHIEFLNSNLGERTFNSPAPFFWKWKITKDKKYLYYVINSFPYSYYAYRASEILNKDVFESFFQLPLCFLVPDENLITAENYERLQLLELSERELRKNIEKSPLDELSIDALARVLVKRGKILEATKTLEELCIKKPLFFKKVLKSKALETLFPKLYENEIEKTAKIYEIDKNLIFSVIRQESRFTPNIISPSGAIGLMQIMPSTGKWISKKIGERNFKESDLFEPSKNIRYGTWYLKYLKDKFKEPYLIIAAYNGGPTYIEKRLNSLNDKDLFIELIEKDETRDYVKKVLFNYWIYNTIEKSVKRNNFNLR